MKILVTDGISQEGAAILTDSGHEVDQTKLSPEDLLAKIGEYDTIIVHHHCPVGHKGNEGGN
jgi:phosphoglycerate dehydrogenase-like enzyme